jgi:TolB-like protein/DNA-binding winged helix-turn-helix (wHTH) protein/Flp pilus assembly protein TadD
VKEESSSSRVLVFDAYELHLHSGELRKSGYPIKLQPQPFRVLALLASRAGQLVTREELRGEIWGEDTFVDFEHGLNFCVQQIRAALGDDADTPHYIETLPRRGYRFLAPVKEIATPLTGRAEAAPLPLAVGGTAERRARFFLAILAGASVVIGVALVSWQWLRPRASPPARRILLAVLPFNNLTGDPGQEYFSDGLTEEMITQLGRLDPERLGVIARTSAMKYKGVQKDAKQIGSELGVAYLLEGSVRREGDRVRIAAQLIEVGGQSELWAESYEEESTARLPFQVGVARDIASHVQQKLAPSVRAAPAESRPVDRKAYELYLRGRYFWNKRSEEGFRKAISSFEEAIKVDPGYARAYAGLADCYNLLNEYSIRPSADSFPKAKAAANKALELDGTLADAHASLAYATMYYDRDWAAADQRFRRAIELNPNHATAHQWYGEFLVAMGRFDEATAEMKKAEQLDPLSLVVNSAVAFSHQYAHHYDLAIEQYRKVIEMEPGFVMGHYGLGLASEQKGDYQLAEAEFEKAIAILGGETDAIAAVGHVQALQGKKEQARKVLARLRALARTKYVAPINVAVLLIALGDNDEAFQWLEKANQERSGWLIFLRVDPRFDAVRNDPRFKALLKQVGLSS